MTRYIVNPINTWPLVTLNFFGKAYFEYIQHFTHWVTLTNFYDLMTTPFNLFFLHTLSDDGMRT